MVRPEEGYTSQNTMLQLGGQGTWWRWIKSLFCHRSSSQQAVWCPWVYLHWPPTMCQGASRKTEIQSYALLNHCNGSWKLPWLVPPLGLPKSIQPRSRSRNGPGPPQAGSLLVASTQVTRCQPAPVTAQFGYCLNYQGGCNLNMPTLVLWFAPGMSEN